LATNTEPYADKRCKGKVLIKPGDTVLLKNLKKRKGSLNYNIEPFFVCSGKHGGFTVQSEKTGKCYKRHATQMKLLNKADTQFTTKPAVTKPTVTKTNLTKTNPTTTKQTLPGLHTNFKPDSRLPGVIDRRAATNPYVNLQATPCSVVIPRTVIRPGQHPSNYTMPLTPATPPPAPSTPTPDNYRRTRWASRFESKPRPNYVEL